MATTTVNESNNVFNYVTDVSSTQANSCAFTQQTSFSGNTIVISDSNVGDISGGTKADMNSACIMGNNQDTMVTNIMQSIAEQTAKTNQSIISFQISTEVNSSQVYQNVNNIISQVQSNTCASTQSNLVNNNTVVVQGSNVGNLALLAEGSLTGSCTQYNAGKMSVSNAGNSSTNQAAAITNILVTIIIVIGIVVIVIVIGVVGLMAFGKLGGKKSDPAAEMEMLNALSGDDSGGAGMEGVGGIEGISGMAETAAELGL